MPRVRDSLRLQGYDYSSPGTYFVTICAYRRELVFEEPAVEDMIESAWTSIPQHFSGTQIDAFVVMPNHFHGIIALNDRLSLVGAQHAGQVDHRAELSTIVRSFKAAVTRELRIRSLWHSGQFWQSNNYDHIVRNESDLARIREYIAYNPIAWQFDYENP